MALGIDPRTRRIIVSDLTPGIKTLLNAHKTRHEDGGADEISVTGLSGLLADDQHVLDAEVLEAMAATQKDNRILMFLGV